MTIKINGDNSVANPGFTGDDTDTGLQVGTDELKLVTGGTARATVDSSGNVGIGESTPLGKLHVKTADSGIASVGSSADDLVIESDTNAGITLVSNTENAINFADSSDVNVGQIAYNHSSNYMLFRVNDSERVRIDSSGNVGIGTTSPNDKLTVGDTADSFNSISIESTNTGIGELRFADSDSANPAYVKYEHTGNNLIFAANSSERMRIDSSGRVGINDTTPDARLDIGGDDADIRLGGSQYFRIKALSTGELTFNDNDTNERMRIDSSGRVGIGTTSPSTKLHVKPASDVTTDGIRVQRQASDGQFLLLNYFGGTGQVAAVDTAGTNPILRFTRSTDNSTYTESMRIDSSGNVGIGLTSASYKLDVSSTTNVARFHHTTSGDTIGMVFRHARGLSGFSGKMVSMQRNDGTEVGSIVIGVSSTAYNTSSDYRLKENVADLDGAINRVRQLAPKRFNFIDDPGRIVDGFLAHEAQTVVPEAVTGEKDGEEMQGIDQSKLVPLLTAALKEAITKIETLEIQNADLTARITALETA